jgi:hypothetical protein
MALVQIFNAAPASIKITNRILPSFSLLSSFMPSCLADSTTGQRLSQRLASLLSLSHV